jgi:alpha-glucosidase (family GH31 glycosyl hydrolase)
MSTDLTLPTTTPNRIALEPNERWWGGLVAAGAQMPFTAQAATHDLRGDHHGNQAAPFLTSNRGRYLWSDLPFEFRFTDGNLEINPVGPVHFGHGGETLRSSYLSAAQRHFPPSGAIPDALLFTHPQYNTWIELLYDQNEVGILEYARTLLKQGYPTGVLMIDDTWQLDYGDWRFHQGRFSNPRAMCDELHAMGFKVMLWVVPFISPDSANFRALEARGVLLKNSSGQTAIRRWWNGYSAVLDFSHPGACAWFEGELERLMHDYGVDGFKFDAGDPTSYRTDDRYFAPSSPTDQCERYPRLGLKYPFNEFRASWRMGGQALAQRQRDKAHAWTHRHPLFGGTTGLDSLIPDAIAQGLMGYPFTCPDMIGGGDYLALDFSSTSNTFDPELFVRSAQAAALMPMMQFSAAPWRLLSAEHAEICRRMAWLHAEHGARILALARDAAHSGEPILRSMEYVFPHQDYAEVKDQFMLGDDQLVAPVLEKGATSRVVVLPDGHWRDDTGSVFIGPQHLEVFAPLERLPRFERHKETI